jgi:copper resistance protein B
MKGMDHGTMPGMDMDHGAKPTMPVAPTGDMPDMNHGAMSKTGQGGMGAMRGMTMGAMQGGSPPPDARSPDYSDGVGYGDMRGMDMYDSTPLGMLLIDQLEVFHGRNGNGQNWEAEGWYGNDSDKLWIRTEGELSRGTLEDGDLEAFWNRNIATYWSSQLGARQDLGAGPDRTWAAFGVQGITPYWFDLEATGYVGASGRTAARLRAEYELLFTQRLILQPELETNLYGKNDPQRRIGSGVSDVQFGMRLRYEFQRQFAPYIGVNWVRRIGTTAEYAQQDGQSALDRQIVAGLRLWF